MAFLKSLFSPNAMRSVSAQEAHELLNSSQPPFVVDVRQPDEYRNGHIAEAKLLPLGELASRMAELPKDRDLLIVCQSGARSGVACQQLAAEGYRVMNLRGGMTAWGMARYDIKRGK